MCLAAPVSRPFFSRSTFIAFVFGIGVFACVGPSALPVAPLDAGGDAGTVADAGAIADAGEGAVAEADAGADSDAGLITEGDAGLDADGGWRGHPQGWIAPTLHGIEAKKGLANCASCHGASLTGAAGPSCDSCHSGWKTNCTFCHGGANGVSGAPPVDRDGKTATTEVSVGAHTAHVTARSGISAPIDCTACHDKPVDALAPGHVDPAPAEVKLSGAGNWNRATATCSQAYCHGGFDGGNAANAPRWTKVDGTQAACGSCHGFPPPAPHPQIATCATCHGNVVNASLGFVNPALHVNGVANLSFTPGSCTDACHGIPPATGSHAAHYGATAAQAGYGDTRISRELSPDGGVYAFGCGNCHPTDPRRHMNGVVNAGGGTAEVDLAPGGAPDASLKAQNAPGAAYTAGGTVVADSRGMAYTLGGTCSGVYCHSRPTFATPDPIPASVRGDAGGFPLYFPPFTLSVAREYAAPAWGGAAPGCDGCHGFPPRTFAPGVSGGAGDSHSYIDSSGEENLHGAVHSFAPIACATCHFATVEVEGVRTTARRDGGTQVWSVYQAVPIANRASHVNGQPDIRFTSVPVRSVTSSPDNYFLADGGARYDRATKTCSGVSCHLLQSSVKWGTPYRPWSNYLECDSCHQY